MTTYRWALLAALSVAWIGLLLPGPMRWAFALGVTVMVLFVWVYDAVER